jgi:cytochrome c556
MTAPALAQDFGNELKARQGMMRIQALQLGILGNMAQGKMEYDAELAQIAADNLVTSTRLIQAPFWPEGSDSMSIDGTRAEPAIWDSYDTFMANWAALGEAAVALQAVAGNGVAEMGPAIGGVGKACGVCHDNYQTPR